MKTKLLLLLLLNSVAIMLNGQIRDSLNAKFVNLNIETDKVVAEKIVRIEQDLKKTWKGVTGCANAPTPKRNIEAAANDWIKDKMFEHRNEKWIRYGWNIPKITYMRWKDGFLNNENNCRGTAEFKIYIEFEKQ